MASNQNSGKDLSPGSIVGMVVMAVFVVIWLTGVCDNKSSDTQKSSASRESSASRIGSFIDSRDGTKYGTAKIGNKTWMTENLNYRTANSRCYKNSESFCERYGLLYHWDAAKNACPHGWHLPTRDEWNGLQDIAGKGGLFPSALAATKLKSKSDWMNNDKGSDDFGFAALPSGRSYGNNSGTNSNSFFSGEGFFFGDFGGADESGYWWSAGERAEEEAYYVEIGGTSMSESYGKKTYGFSVRCVQN